jgi:hypothetical protein
MNLVHHICWEIIIFKGASNSLKAKKGSKNIVARELGDIKGTTMHLMMHQMVVMEPRQWLGILLRSDSISG